MTDLVKLKERIHKAQNELRERHDREKARLNQTFIIDIFQEVKKLISTIRRLADLDVIELYSGNGTWTLGGTDLMVVYDDGTKGSKSLCTFVGAATDLDRLLTRPQAPVWEHLKRLNELMTLIVEDLNGSQALPYKTTYTKAGPKPGSA